MTKKNYIVLGVTAVILLGVIIIILVNKQSSNWTKDILKTNYDVYYIDCENTENKLDKEVLNKIDTYWKELSNNGPWTGSNDKCYDTFTIRYDNNNVVQKIDLQIVDNDSVVLKTSNGNVYYNHANNLVTYFRSVK